jgi:hypothetical protein
VEGGEGMSNRAKFRALPVDHHIMAKIQNVRSVVRVVLQRAPGGFWF